MPETICPPPETLLLESVKKNDHKTIKILISSDKNLLTHKYPYTSKTILQTACTEHGVYPSTIELLIERGADLKGNAEWKPLHLAVQNPDSSILEVVLKNIKRQQININDTVYGNTALHTLIKSNAIKENEERFCKNVELLLEYEINVNQGDGKNLSAVFWAAKNGYRHVVKTILEKSKKKCSVDLDSHKLGNETARGLITEKGLYSGALPEKISCQTKMDKIFSSIKLGKEDEIIKEFKTFENPSDFVNLDDGTSTLLQYSCEKGLTKIANYLIDRDAQVNKNTHNCPKRPLELAAENGYYEILEKLLQKNLEITPGVFCDMLKHADRPKFDKVDYEKCCQIVLNKLESHKVVMDVDATDELNSTPMTMLNKPESTKVVRDINATDESRNTPIHYALRYCDEDTTHKLLKLGASLASKNSFKKMPIEDIKSELLERHLDECIKFNLNNKNDEKREFELVFDYQSLIPPSRLQDDPEDVRRNEMVPETEVIAYMSRAPEFRDLLKHPVIVSFLFMKWHRICSLFYTNLLFYFLFVASLIAYIFSYYANFDEQSGFALGIGSLSHFTLSLTFWILLLREIFQMMVSPTNYFKNFENFLEIVLIIITGMILYIKSPTEDTRKQLAAVAILLGAFELLLMLGQHPKLSTNVVMLKTVSVNFFKLLLWYSLLLVAFALSFCILFAKPTKITQNTNATNAKEEDPFTGAGQSLFKTIVMLTGEFDAGSIKFQTYPITGKLIFSLFVFMITVVLLNLLNGLAVSDTQSIKNEAELVGHIARAQHIYYVESMLLGNILPISLINRVQSLFCCCPSERSMSLAFFHAPLARRVCIFKNSQNCQLVVFPNDQGRICYGRDANSKQRENKFSCSCSDTCLDMETVKRIQAIVKDRRDKAEKPKINTLENLHAEMADLKTKMNDLLSTFFQNTKEDFKN